MAAWADGVRRAGGDPDAGRAEPLIELYLARLDTRDEVPEKTDILRKVARVFEEQLDDKGQAHDALLTAFEMDFSDMETVRYLERMTQATNRWPELVQTVNGWLQAQTDPMQKITICLRLAKWYAEDLGHTEYAQPYYGQILQLDPNNSNFCEVLNNGGFLSEWAIGSFSDVEVTMQSSGTVTCALGTIASGANATVSLKVRPQSSGSVTNQASVGSSMSTSG